MKIILLGPPGSGKDTQAQRLARATGVEHISAGHLIRHEIQANTALGRQMKGSIDRGQLFSPSIILDIVTPRLKGQAWILNGLPRTQAQAEGLDLILEAAGASLDCVVALSLPDVELVERLMGRRYSQATGNVYHVLYNPPPDTDSGPYVKRDDDTPESIERRLAIYHSETEPLMAYYARQGLLLEFDARMPIASLTDTILSRIRAAARVPQAHVVSS